MKIIFFLCRYYTSGGNENEVQYQDISLFDILNVKLSCEDHSAGSEPILNMDIPLLDNTVSSDHIQLAQSSPKVQHDSSKVSLYPILDNTHIDEVNPVFNSETDHEIDPGLHKTTITPNTESTILQYILPPRSNRDQPPVRYEPDPQSKAKYPISNYVSTHKLSRLYASFISQLSSISIPSNVQEALADPRWTKAR